MKEDRVGAETSTDPVKVQNYCSAESEVTNGNGALGRLSSFSPPNGSDNDGVFNLEALKLPQDFEVELGVQKQLLTIPVRRPDNQSFFQVHPSPGYRFSAYVLEVKNSKETFLVDQALWPSLQAEIVPKALYTCMDRNGVLSLWPVKLPNQSGNLDSWNRSAHAIAARAMQKWVRIVSNHALGGYEALEARGDLSEPTWPDLQFEELVNIAFKDRVIASMDHPQCRALRGEI